MNGNRNGEINMRKIELSPLDQKQLEEQLKRSIKKCNESIKKCVVEGDKKSEEYIREVKRKPLIKKLYDVRQGYIWE